MLIYLCLSVGSHAEPDCDRVLHSFACVRFLLAIVPFVALGIDSFACAGFHVPHVARSLRTYGDWTSIHSFFRRFGRPWQLPADCDEAYDVGS